MRHHLIPMTLVRSTKTQHVYRAPPGQIAKAIRIERAILSRAPKVIEVSVVYEERK